MATAPLGAGIQPASSTLPVIYIVPNNRLERTDYCRHYTYGHQFGAYNNFPHA
jgi:hypothetical protein